MPDKSKHKDHGPPPGEVVLRQESYSHQRACRRNRHRLQYHIRYYSTFNIKTFKVDSWLRISKRDFRWYKNANQIPYPSRPSTRCCSRSRNADDARNSTDFRHPRKAVYHILLLWRDRDKFDFVFIAGRRARDQKRVSSAGMPIRAGLHRNRQKQSRFFRCRKHLSSCTLHIMMSAKMIQSGELSAQKCGKNSYPPR